MAHNNHNHSDQRAGGADDAPAAGHAARAGFFTVRTASGVFSSASVVDVQDMDASSSDDPPTPAEPQASFQQHQASSQPQFHSAHAAGTVQRTQLDTNDKVSRLGSREVDQAGLSRLIQLSPELQAALQAMLDPLVVADANGCIMIFNTAASKLFGYGEREVVGESVTLFMDDATASAHAGYMERFLHDPRKQGRIVGTPGREVLAKHRDGSFIPVWLTINYKTIGHHALFVACMRDLRESKRQQEQLIRMNERLRSVMRAMLDPMVVCDADSNILVFNPAATQLFGYAESEAIGSSIKMLMPDAVAAVHDGYMKHYLETGETKVIGMHPPEVMVRHKDGTLIPVMLSVSDSSTTLSDGRTDISFTACIHDLRKLKQREVALERANGLLRCSMEAMLDPLVIISTTGIVVMVNPATNKLFGYDNGELMGQNVAILCEPAIAAIHDSFLKRYLETGQARILGKQSREVIARKKDGSLFPILLSTSERKGDPHLFVGCIHDLSLVRQREHELVRTRKRVDEANEEIRRTQAAMVALANSAPTTPRSEAESEGPAESPILRPAKRVRADHEDPDNGNAASAGSNAADQDLSRP